MLYKEGCTPLSITRFGRLANMESMSALNILELNIMQNLMFMFKFKMNLLPSIFNNFFKISKSDKHNLQSNSLENYSLPKKISTLTANTISYRGPKLWNSFK